MARNRQRAKERQAARRAARQAERGEGPLPPGEDAEEQAYLKDGAPPEDVGHSDALLESLEESDADEDIEQAADRELELEAEEAAAFSDEPV